MLGVWLVSSETLESVSVNDSAQHVKYCVSASDRGMILLSSHVARGRRWVRRARRAHGGDRERGQQEGDDVVTLYRLVWS